MIIVVMFCFAHCAYVFLGFAARILSGCKVSATDCGAGSFPCTPQLYSSSWPETRQ